MPKNHSKFKKREQYCYMAVDGKSRYVKVKSSSIELKRYYGGEEESIPGSELIIKEREPGLFSIHEKSHQKKCLAIDPEWQGQKDTENTDEVNNLIVYEKFQGKTSQLFRLIRVSKKYANFHLVSQLKNEQGQDVAMVYKDKKLRISTYDPKNDAYEVYFYWTHDLQ